ncbi:MAG TPA: hypothetical protein ENN41_04885 [Sediminispirochaeta sp.]|nr:hypothetical protein [Sediminispirochaeta sp.]
MKLCVVITGAVNSGKSSRYKEYIDREKERGRKVAGLGTVTLVEEGLKVGYDVVDIRTGIRRSLVLDRRRYFEGRHTSEGRQYGERYQEIGRFVLFEEGLRFAESTLLEAGGIEDFRERVELIGIDEIGPLEMRGGGYAPVLKRLLAEYDGDLLLVARLEILSELESLLRSYQWRVKAEMADDNDNK